MTPQPRVWRDEDDIDPDVAEVVGGRSGILYTRVSPRGSAEWALWQGYKTSGEGFRYWTGELLDAEGHVTEVLSPANPAGGTP
jgi:hypothetical protein